MGWRRFTQGHVGALSARQYSEVQDAVQALVSDRGGMDARQSRSPFPMLVRITGKYAESRVGEPGTVEGAEVIDATSYLFEQVFVRLSRGPGTVEVATRPYGTKSRQQEGQDEDFTLVAIDPSRNSDIPDGTLATVIPLDVDAGESGTEMPTQQGLYLIVGMQDDGAVGVYTVLAAMPGGMYSVRRVEDTAGDPVMMENLYETSNYYGALLAPQNPCATLTARRLGPGDRVFGFTSGGALFTCSPTAWTVVCQPCGTNPGGALASTYDAAGAEAIASSMMLKGL
jgi:hypothetical protein